MELSSQQGSQQYLCTPSKEAMSSTYRFTDKTKINPALKPGTETCLDQIQAVLKHQRPLTAPFNMSNPQIEATPLFHRENKGLRSEGKFRKFIENVKEMREKSEAIVHKNNQNIEEMHNNSPEKMEMSEYLADFMDKNYLRTTKKQDIANIRFTKYADVLIQEKKFKSMRKTLDEVNYERKNPKKVVKYMTNNHVDPTNLALPKFVSYESKVKAPEKVNPLAYQNEQITYDKARQELANLIVVDNPETIHSYYYYEDPLEQNKVELKKLKDSIVSFEKSISTHRPLKVETLYTEEAEDIDKMGNSSMFRSPSKPHHSKKNLSKKSAIERRVKGQKPIEDLIKGAISDTERTEAKLPTQINSPLTPNFDFSAMKMSINLSNFNSPIKTPAKSAGIFGQTQIEDVNSRMTSPLFPQKGIENYSSADFYGFNADEDDLPNDLMQKRYEKMKKMLQTSSTSKHVRVANDRIMSRERYNISINSAVSNENANKVITQSKTQFFKQKLGGPKSSFIDKLDKAYMNPAEKTKAKVFDTYKNLAEACQTNSRSMPALQRSLKKNFGVLNETFKNMNQHFEEGELDLNDQIKQDIMAEMQHLSSATFKPTTKQRKIMSAHSKKR